MREWRNGRRAGLRSRSFGVWVQIPSPAPRRRGLHIVRDDFFIKKSSLTHSVAPPFRKKARGSRLCACKRTHDGFVPLPPFCGGTGVQIHLPKAGKIFFVPNRQKSTSSVRSLSIFTSYCFTIPSYWGRFWEVRGKRCGAFPFCELKSRGSEVKWQSF